MTASAKPCDEVFVPFPASLAVVKAENMLVEDGFGSEQDEFTADFAPRPDEIKAPSPWSGRFAVALMETVSQCLRFTGAVGITNDPGFISEEEGARTKLKSEVIPRLLAVLNRQPPYGSVKSGGIFSDGAVEIKAAAHFALMKPVPTKGCEHGHMRSFIPR